MDLKTFWFSTDGNRCGLCSLQQRDCEVGALRLPIAQLGIEAVAVPVVRGAEIGTIQMMREDSRGQWCVSPQKSPDDHDAGTIEVVIVIRLQQKIAGQIMYPGNAIADNSQFD